MSLSIDCSAKYFQMGDRVFDKITDEFDPPSYWFRLKIRAKNQRHKKCSGHISGLWYENGRRVKGFDPLMLLWLNEPVEEETAVATTHEYFAPDIAAGEYEMAGLMHVKLPPRPRDPNIPLPPQNIPDAELPEVRLDMSSKEPKYFSKRVSFPYGIYYVQVSVGDESGSKTKKIFKIWAFRDSEKCRIRSSRSYERWNLFLKSFLAPL